MRSLSQYRPHAARPTERMTTPSLEASVKQAAAVGSEPSRCGFELSRNILLGVRESRARRPDLVVQFGTYLLDHHAQRLGQEVWNVYEQVLVALLEHGKQPSGGRGKSKRAVPTGESEPLATAQDYCNILALQFPKSLRVKRLEAMLWEAKGELDMAMADYEEILKEDPNHLGALKRQAALNPATRVFAHPSALSTHRKVWPKGCSTHVDLWRVLCARRWRCCARAAGRATRHPSSSSTWRWFAPTRTRGSS